MRLALALAILLAATVANAATLTGNVQDATGSNVRQRLTFTPQSVRLAGSVLTLDVPRAVTSDTNGDFSIYLKGGAYSVTAGTTTFPILIPTNEVTFTLRQAADLAANAAMFDLTNIVIEGVGGPTNGITAAQASAIAQAVVATNVPSGLASTNYVDATRTNATLYALSGAPFLDTSLNALGLNASTRMFLDDGGVYWKFNGDDLAYISPTGNAGFYGRVYVGNGAMADNNQFQIDTGAGAVFWVGTNGAAGGNGSGLTNINGANFQAGTINSNKLDAATRALLGGGGSSGIATSNGAGTNTFLFNATFADQYGNTNWVDASGSHFGNTNGAQTDIGTRGESTINFGNGNSFVLDTNANVTSSGGQTNAGNLQALTIYATDVRAGNQVYAQGFNGNLTGDVYGNLTGTADVAKTVYGPNITRRADHGTNWATSINPDASRGRQFYATNQSFTIAGISNLSTNAWMGTCVYSNSGASPIFVAAPVGASPIGGVTTNQLYIPATKCAYWSWDVVAGAYSNYCNAVGQ